MDGPIPTDTDAELAVLGAMMMSPTAFEEARACLGCRNKAFALPVHAAIYAALLAVSDSGEPIDLLPVQNRLTAAETPPAPPDGWPDYLIRCCESYADTANAGYYAGRVLDCWRRRELMRLGLILKSQAQDSIGHEDLTELVARHTDACHALTAGDRLVYSGQTVISEIPERMAKRRTIASSILDSAEGWERPCYAIVAAAPSTGKTSLALNIVLELAERGIGSIFVSCETDRHKLAERMIAIATEESSNVLRNHKSPDERVCAANATRYRLKADILLVDSLVGIREIAAVATAQCRKDANIGLIVLDYIQLCTLGERTENRNIEIGRISARLKRLSLDTGTIVLALSQINRAASTSGKEPGLHSLRDSGTLEQDADIVMLLHDKTRDAHDPITGRRLNQTAEIKVIVAKNRDGPQTDYELWFHKPTFRFQLAQEAETVAKTKADMQRREALVPITPAEDDPIPF